MVTWLEPKLVCEVAYQVLTRDMRLRMARFKRLRNDKPPEQCTIDQIMEAKKMETAPEQKKVAEEISVAKEKLSEYASKRHFEETPEPKNNPEKKGEKFIYVIQEHHARRLHYDFRLEKDGVLKSWAVPKGMPETGQKVLAVETEDHPYEVCQF